MHAVPLTLAAFSLLAVCAQAEAATQRYVLQSYPSASPECHTLVRDLGARIAADHGVTVTSATCNPPSEAGGVDLRIEYTADEALPLVSTRPGLSATIEAGWFVTQADCQGALVDETAHFEATTGLTSFVSYCYHESLARDYPWVPRIDAFGDAAMKPFYAGTLLFGSPFDHTRATFESTILDALASAGVDVRRVTVANVSGYATVTAIVYAAERPRLETGEFGGLDDRAQCEEQKAVLEGIYATLDTTPALAIFCVAGTLGGTELQGIFLGDVGFDVNASVEMFQTYAACSAERAGLIEMYRNAGRNVAGGVCSRQTDPSAPRGWSVKLFE